MPAWLKRSLIRTVRRPFRTTMITLFLALVVGLFTVMATVNRLAAARMAELETKLETVIEVRPYGSIGLGGPRSQPLPLSVEREIAALGADLRVDAYLVWREFGEDSTAFYIGARPGAPLRAVGDLEPLERRLVAGRVFTAEEASARVAAVGLDLARDAGFAQGRPGPDSSILLRGGSWRIVGVFDGGTGFINGQAFVPFEAMRDAFGAQGVSRVIVSAPSARRSAEVAQALAERLAGQADVVTNRSALELAQRSLAGIAGATRSGAAAFFLAAALVVAGAMALAFREQRREIGIQKALGASDAMIARQLLAESVVLSGLGGLGGVGVAIAGLLVYGRSWTSIKFDLVQAPLPPLAVTLVLAACVVLGALGSLYPILRSRGLDPVAILRGE